MQRPYVCVGVKTRLDTIVPTLDINALLHTITGVLVEQYDLVNLVGDPAAAFYLSKDNMIFMVEEFSLHTLHSHSLTGAQYGMGERDDYQQLLWIIPTFPTFSTSKQLLV